MKDLAIIFSGCLFFLAVFFLFKQALVTAAAIMGFSLLWFLAGAWYRKFELLYLVATTKGGNS